MEALDFQKRLALYINQKHNSKCGHMELVPSPIIDDEKRLKIFFMNGSGKKYIVKYGKETARHKIIEDSVVLDVFEFENTPVLILKS